jgi:hypothetical protein
MSSAELLHHTGSGQRAQATNHVLSNASNLDPSLVSWSRREMQKLTKRVRE